MQRLSLMAVLLAASLLPMAAHAQRGMGGRVSTSAPSRGGSGFAPRPMPASSAFGPHSMGALSVRTIGTVGPHVFVSNRAFVPRSGVRVSVGFGGGFRSRRFRDFDFDDF